jgi:hypothetical protein
MGLVGANGEAGGGGPEPDSASDERRQGDTKPNRRAAAAERRLSRTPAGKMTQKSAKLVKEKGDLTRKRCSPAHWDRGVRFRRRMGN